MKKSAFLIKKWGVRAMVAVGSLFGISLFSCTPSQSHDDSSASASEDKKSDVEVVEDVYGPPVEDIDDISSYETVYGPPVEDLEPESEPESSQSDN